VLFYMILSRCNAASVMLREKKQANNMSCAVLFMNKPLSGQRYNFSVLSLNTSPLNILESLLIPHGIAIFETLQAELPNMLIVKDKINSFKLCCAPIDFIGEMSIFSTISTNRTCVSAQIRPLVRKHPLEALTSKASRGYSFN